MPVTFTTTGLPEALRTERWEDHNARALIGLRCRTLSTAVLAATEVNLQLEHVHLARVQGTAHVVERDQALIARRPAESVALFFSLAGAAFFYHDDGVWTVRPGQLLICDADQPFMRGFSQGLEELVLKIPRHQFAQATGVERIDRPIAVSFSAGGNSFAHTLAREIAAATRADGPHPVDEAMLVNLVAALAGRGRDDLPAAHRAAAQTFIDQHLADPELAAPAVARAVGISPRQLSRVFAEVGTSIPGYVRARRLEQARTLLEGAGAASLSIAEVARRCGFASAAHFSTAFRTRFGERAVDVRRRAQAARTISLR
jgi:AraC-like DNA-binding protein